MALYAFDGTWQDASTDDNDKRTNVYHFKHRYGLTDTQQAYYWPGVGSRFGKLGRILGLVAGLGARHRVALALTQAYEQFKSGDEVVDVVGFSRGAATAAAFVWALHEWGVRAPAKTTPFTLGLMKYRRGALVKAKPAVRFVGLFDTVFSSEDLISVLPIAQGFKSHGGEGPLRGGFELPQNVQAAFHAMAIHERTLGFELTRIQNAHEVWFPGVHSDIGSGAISMHWMATKARSLGVPLNDDDASINYDASVPEAYKERNYKRRKIHSKDRIHKSAVDLPLDADLDTLVIEDS